MLVLAINLLRRRPARRDSRRRRTARELSRGREPPRRHPRLRRRAARGARHLSFEVEKGETLCIVGESGCGKSLTSLALMDLLPSKAIRTADR
jgi:ABC-type transport system involved in cytochrome bd biosynthesis fused ATPase/permease subunit